MILRDVFTILEKQANINRFSFYGMKCNISIHASVIC
jgi:hypothetical protein